MEYINKSYIEAARVFLKQTDHTTIVIKCVLCNIDGLLEWSSFLQHLAVRHSVFAKSSHGLNLELDEEIKNEVELELQNLSNNYYDEIETVNSDAEIEINDCEITGDIRNETDTQEEVSDSNEVLKKYTIVNNILKYIFQHNVVYKPRQPFYSLRNTSTELMEHFIDQLRQHKYLWSEEYRNMGFKKERSESASQICQALRERFNIFLTPQVVSNSACSLLSWFKKQHAMFLRNEEHICRYQVYYEQLLAFIPTKDVCNMDCDICKRSFHNEEQLRRHRYREHDGSLPYICEECQQGFSCASKLRMHQIRLHKKPTRWQCTMCSYCAPNKWDLEVHMPFHSGERKYTCELCGVSIKSSSSLAKHRRTHLKLK